MSVFSLISKAIMNAQLGNMPYCYANCDKDIEYDQLFTSAGVIKVHSIWLQMHHVGGVQQKRECLEWLFFSTANEHFAY